MRLVGEDLDPGIVSARARQAGVTGHEGGVQRLGESHVCRIVGGQRIPQFPYPFEKRLMRPAGQWKIDEVAKRLTPPRVTEITSPSVAAKDLHHLDVEEVRSEEWIVRSQEALGASLSEGSTEKRFDERRGINNGHFASRSARTAAEADSVERTRFLDSSRCLSSPMVGRSATTCICARRYSESEVPSRAARALRRRWSSSGTFRIWIIFMWRTYFHAADMSKDGRPRDTL